MSIRSIRGLLPDEADMPPEVVTHASVRDIELGSGAGVLALITLDNGQDQTKPNTFGYRGLLSLHSALDAIAARVARGEVAAVGLTGKPPGLGLGIGADLRMAAAPFAATRTDPARARGLALGIPSLGHAVFRRLGELGVPSFAFMKGVAIGGGLEVALHCTYRTISSGLPMIALPECFLGMVPGWGGSYLLPRLIGPSAALKVIIENPLSGNRMLRGREAFALGIADAMFEPADFLEESLRWAAGVLAGSVCVPRRELAAAAEWDAAVAAARLFADGKVRGAALGPYRALDLVAAARTQSRDEGFAAEDEALADMIVSDQLPAGFYAHDLLQIRTRHPAGAPPRPLARRVRKAGVVGAGPRGAQIAGLIAAQFGVPVLLTGLDQAADEVADADFVIEALAEDLAVKRRAFAELEAIVRAECVLATSTSVLSVTAVAAGLAYPERVVGFHFFTPVSERPLVEVVRGAATDDTAVATTIAVARKLGYNCVIVADRPGFVVNRLLTRFLGEVTRAAGEGTPFEVAEHAADPLGLPMTPAQLLQAIGPDVTSTLNAALPDRFGAPLADGDRPSTGPEVLARALEGLAQEIRAMLDEGVVAAPEDIDLCMMLGAGWPFHLGGITPHLDATGIAAKVNGAPFRGVWPNLP